jgi:DNA-binding transcriptional ArsR family regulator
MASNVERRLQSADELRALANPLRLRLYYALTSHGPSTSARLAERLDAPPALVSYHLRRLSDFGLVVESDPQDEDLRKRWWKASEGSLTFSPADFRSDPKGRRAAKALQHLAVERQFRALEQYQDGTTDWGEEWDSASFSSDRLMFLAPDQLRALHQELEEVVARWASSSPDDSAGSPADVLIFMHAFPFTDK